MTTQTQVNEAFAQSECGYSFDRYGAYAWRVTCRWLLNQGLTVEETVEFMRSKHTRWAGDFNNDEGRKSKWVEKYVGAHKYDLKKLVQELV